MELMALLLNTPLVVVAAAVVLLYVMGKQTKMVQLVLMAIFM
ncbi:MAG: hypothetical protein Q4E26_06930 [Prevotellaceae bacterium]|nr:hypothetical protein [Prevotellaceae bacterium]